MFWRMPALSASSPVEAILDKEEFNLEELLDEEEIIQECKALNARLINYLRDGTQVEHLLRYIVEEPPEDAEMKRKFKFPFIACEIFTCEIDVILRTLVEDEELMNLLFSFLEPHRSHGTSLAGYFSKVVVCLMLRKTVPLMNYVQVHEDIFGKLVDLIGVTSIMEVLVRLVGTDDHLYPNFVEVMQWLADSNLLEMIIEKLSPSNTPEVHANAAETLSAITRNIPSPLTAKMCSPSFVEKIFDYALESSSSKSTLVHSLSVCISLLDPKKPAPSLFNPFRSQHLYEPSATVKPETVSAMLPKLGELLLVLDVSSDERILLTTYGKLNPPLGKHRLKIVEFIAVLLRTGYEGAENALASSGSIRRVLDLFFEYPFNNALHHLVENIVISCLESSNIAVLEHLFKECSLIEKLIQGDKNQNLLEGSNMPTLPRHTEKEVRNGNIGHITRIANKIAQLESTNNHIYMHLENNEAWHEWQAITLRVRNAVENVYKWSCGRPSALQDRMRDSDDEDVHDRDYDVPEGISGSFRYNNAFENEEADEVHASLEQNDGDIYFDDDSAEVVMSSLRLGEDHEGLFTNSNWFAFQEDRMSNELFSTPSSSGSMPETYASSGDSSSDDEVVVGVDEEMEGLSKLPEVLDGPSSSGTMLSTDSIMNGSEERSSNVDGSSLFGETRLPDWAEWPESLEGTATGADKNPFEDDVNTLVGTDPSQPSISSRSILSNGEFDTSNGVLSKSYQGHKEAECNGQCTPSLFEEDVEFVGVELEGSEKAMERALKEGIVGEAAPLKKNLVPVRSPEKEKSVGEEAAVLEFNDANYWRVEHEAGLVQE